ncbi:hypothetical protein CCB80_14040 [Armatimonadetes bacterium Uphvl-Ar1]|nr:hypothetical protein CCB80_14040 [Armatimonadetes bacterium Uphvl-Ar1]
MNKRFTSALAGTILIGGALGVAVAQNKAVAETNAPLPAPAPQSMSAGEMINYLKEQDTKFIVETTKVDPNKKFEVNLKGLSSDEAAKAIAQALDLAAFKEGNVWILRDGMPFGFTFNGMDGLDFDFEEMKELQGLSELKNLKELEKMNFEFKGLSEQQRKEMDKAMEEVEKALSKVKIEINEGELKGLEEKIRKEVGAATRIELKRIDDLIKSITSDQWKLMEKQGHLKLSDLTPVQRELLGNPKGDDEISITIDRDGKKLTIKN